MKFLARACRYLIVAGCAWLPIAVAAQPSDPLCRAKYDTINAQLTAAKAQGQQHKARGLQQALDQVSRNCTDDKLKSEYAERVHKQEQEVAERQRDLAEARAEGRTDKIARRESKLREAQDELQRLKDAGPG